MDGVCVSTIPHDRVHETIEESITYFQQRNHPFRWYTSPLTQPRDLGHYLQQHGLEAGSPSPAMAIELDHMSSTLSLPQGLEIHTVADVPMLETWFRIWLACYGMLEHKDALFEIEQALGIDDAQVDRLLGYWHGRPVASSMGFYNADVARINVVATLPDARKRGIGTAMVSTQLQKACDAGYHVAVLYAAPLGVDMYQRLGFMTIHDIVSYRFGHQTYRPH
jgi:predicted GNAT family acetyltransferase